MVIATLPCKCGGAMSDDLSNHDDVIKWKHFPRYWPFVRGIHRSPVNSPNKGQWRGALIFSLICTWSNGWINNRNAGDLRRHYAHYDVTVMFNPSCDICLPGLLYSQLISSINRCIIIISETSYEKSWKVCVSSFPTVSCATSSFACWGDHCIWIKKIERKEYILYAFIIHQF